METIKKKLELLTKNDEKNRLLIISVSDTARKHIWSNKEIPIIEESILII